MRSSPRRPTPQEVAERSQRQLGWVALFGSLIPILVVAVVLAFHFTRGSAVTGSSVIEEEKHIVHKYRMGHHKTALRDLNDLIHDKPLSHWILHLDLMEEFLRKTNLQGGAESCSACDSCKKGKDKKKDALYREIDLALGAVTNLRKEPDNAGALADLDTHVKWILSFASDSEAEGGKRAGNAKVKVDL